MIVKFVQRLELMKLEAPQIIEIQSDPLTNFVTITFTVVEENFENSPSKMLQNGPQSN